MKKLTTVMVLSLPLFLLPLHGADADSEPRERSIYGNTGVAAGGIAMANINGKFAVSLTPNTFSSNVSSALGSYKNDSVSQARDGTIAFSSNRGGKGWRIYAMRSDGSRQRQLTFSTPETLRADIGQWANDINPSISPDGKRIAFLSQRSAFVKSSPKSHYDLYVMNVDVSQVRILTDVDYSPERNGYIRSAVFGPDSRRIAYRGNVVLNENGQVVNREVVGFINIDGSDPSYFVTNDCAGGAVLDWVGDALLYSYGGAVQGCEYMTKYIVRSLSSGESAIIPGETLGNFGMGGPAGADRCRGLAVFGPAVGQPAESQHAVDLPCHGAL